VNKLEAPKSYRQQRRMKLVRCIFLVLNKRTKYCKKKKKRHKRKKKIKKKKKEGITVQNIVKKKGKRIRMKLVRCIFLDGICLVKLG